MDLQNGCKKLGWRRGLGLHVGPLAIGEARVVSDMDSGCLVVSCFPLDGLPCLASIEEDVLSPDASQWAGISL